MPGRIEQDRHRRRPLRAAGQPVRRRLHRLAADQPVRRHGRRTRADDRSGDASLHRRPRRRRDARHPAGVPARRARGNGGDHLRGRAHGTRGALYRGQRLGHHPVHRRRARMRAIAPARTSSSPSTSRTRCSSSARAAGASTPPSRPDPPVGPPSACSSRPTTSSTASARTAVTTLPASPRRCAMPTSSRLQEVDRHWQRSGNVDAPAVLGCRAAGASLGVWRESRHGREHRSTSTAGW